MSLKKVRKKMSWNWKKNRVVAAGGARALCLKRKGRLMSVARSQGCVRKVIVFIYFFVLFI